MNLPAPFAFLATETGPNILRAALKDFGLHEVPGPDNSPRIMQMAKNVGASSYYKNDATPWCALAVSDWAKQAGLPLPNDPLAALSWAAFGTPVQDGAKLGDVLVKKRVGGGHVGLYVGENAAGTHYAVLGGNQADSVCIAWFPKSVFTHVRRSPWKVAQPKNVRRVVVGATGPVAAVRED